MKPKISVIVPIYNTEPYLNECLISIRNQTFKNIEIICVDDCSPDNSYKIVEKHSEEDSRIKLVRHSRNRGSGGATINTGIKLAQANYIAGVDSDDTIKPEMMEKLWNASNNGKYDVVCCGYDRVNEDGEVLSSEIFKSKDVKNINNSLDVFLIMNPGFVNKLWRRSLFVDEGIFFPEGIFFEDMATTPRVLTNVKNVKFIESSLYNYFQRKEAVTSTFSAKHICDHFKAYEIILAYLKQRRLLDHYAELFKAYIDNGMRFHSDCVVKSDMKEKEIDQYLRFLLMMKISFLENHDLLLRTNRSTLLSLLKTARLAKDFSSVSASNNLSYMTPPKLELSAFQKMGSALFGWVFKPLIEPKQRNKLRMNPVSFFHDSKQCFTRAVGKMLKII